LTVMGNMWNKHSLIQKNFRRISTGNWDAKEWVEHPVFFNCRISDCIVPEHAVDFMRDRKFDPFGLIGEGNDGM
jgi:hypothetical protein